MATGEELTMYSGLCVAFAVIPESVSPDFSFVSPDFNSVSPAIVTPGSFRGGAQSNMIRLPSGIVSPYTGTRHPGLVPGPA